MHAFQVGDRALIDPSAFTRAGESCVITRIDEIDEDIAVVRFDDGNESAYFISDGEIILQGSLPIAVTTHQAINV